MSYVHFDLPTILSLVSTFAIVIALLFAAVQLRQANRSRTEQAAIAVIHNSQGDSWTRALEGVSRLPAEATVDQIYASGPETAQLIFDFGIRLETIGYMTFLRLVSIEMIDDLLGGTILVFWSRAAAWIESERVRLGSPKFLEWCEWLADRVRERRALHGHLPAQIKHRDWR